ncbi:cyd operon YbgE family protein [Pseudomonas sp. nanlin1]|uniref:cyd operon YbgE family protein n=1 Tax=Pseudomonas sp. nanlin1 TaxID=3040605 RepID=UPI00388EFC17
MAVIAEQPTLVRRPGSRWVSLLLAAPISLVLLLHPMALVNEQGGYSHGVLSLMLWGVAAGYVHGLGFDPRALVWRWVFHPVLAWGLMGLGYGALGGWV